MLDNPFTDHSTHLANAADELTARICAVAAILLENGLCTVEDLDRKIVLSRSMIDQKRAEEKALTLKQLEEQSPLLAELFKAIKDNEL
jgi:putative intracellular protease/amidase